ncbi:MAG TPA: NAD-dependent epimerase/dehydratase family protein, partial [Victivallales bacterium]|nr:NAD-dependent epimerase/dehydratase family protein [Victivallales bacterium]
RKNSSLERVHTLFKVWGNDNRFSMIEWFDGDILEEKSIENLLLGVDYFFHCAAMVSFLPSEREKMIETNVNGTKIALKASLNAKLKKLCYVSSIAALGREQDKNKIINEDTKWQESKSNSAYSKSKYLAEQEVWDKIKKFGLNAVIVNPSVIIAAAPDNKSSAKFFFTAEKGNPFFTDGINGFVDVRDVSKAMIELCESHINGERFILNEGNYSYRKIFELIAKYLGKNPPYIRLTPFLLNLLFVADKIRSSLIGSQPILSREIIKTATSKYFYSNEKIEKHLDFKFIPIEIAIKEHSEFFQKIRRIHRENF